MGMTQLTWAAALLMTMVLVVSNFDTCQGQQQTCYYSYYYRRYICQYVNPIVQPIPVQNTVQSCSRYQRNYYYSQSSFDSCCGPQSVVTSGVCCKARFYVSSYDTRTYCMCSTGATCRNANVIPQTPRPVRPTPRPVVPTTKPTTTTTTTTPTTTTTTTTVPTTTTPTTTTTTTPTTTTTTPTTTTPTTTIAPVKKVCPTYRLLNSEAANECDYPGITAIERPNRNGGVISSCNAVLVPAQINGVTKPAFFTTKLCRTQIQTLAIKGGTEFNFRIGGKLFPLDVGSMFDIIDDPTKGSSFFVIKDRFASLVDFGGSCQHPACIMTRSMVGDIDYSNCEVVSYGASNAADLSSTGLRKVKVHVTINDVCSGQGELFGEVNTMCFVTSSGKNLFCSNDSSAPVFCTAKSNEKVLIGAASFQKSCDTSPSFRLVPYPVTNLKPVPLAGSG